MHSANGFWELPEEPRLGNLKADNRDPCTWKKKRARHPRCLVCLPLAGPMTAIGITVRRFGQIPEAEVCSTKTVAKRLLVLHNNCPPHDPGFARNRHIGWNSRAFGGDQLCRLYETSG